MIKTYKDLEVYQEGYRLAIGLYKLLTQLPASAYELVKQTKKASISIPLNIAEGYGKKDSVAEFKRFLRMSAGSVNEVEVLLEMLKDLEYIDYSTYEEYIAAYKVLGKRISVMLSKWN